MKNNKLLNDNDIETIKSLPEIILNQPKKPLDAAMLAREAKLDIDKLHLGTAVVFKCGVKDLINDIKLKKVSQLLLSSKKTLAEIAFENGFKNRSQFYKVFSEKFQCDPNNYSL